MKLFVFGLGFSAQQTVAALRAQDAGVAVAGTVRTEEKAAHLREQGIAAHVFTGDQPGPTLGADLRDATHVLLSIAPGEAGDPALQHHRADLQASSQLQWLCYYSTVGVYGDFGGAWIDEDAPLVPRNDRSDRRVHAENDWRDVARTLNLPLAILRLAGIYGPGRSTFDKLRDGTARRLVKPGQVFNRIHVADIGRVTALAAERRLAGTFNLADDEPAPPQDLVTFAADLLDVPPPPETPFASAQLSPMQRSFYADNKRVSNRAIKAALGTQLQYPTYREGLRAILAGEG